MEDQKAEPGQQISCGTGDLDAGRPPWLTEAIEEFNEHSLKPYRPPRFSDGTYLHEVVLELEEEHEIEIRFIGMNVREGDPWETQIDGRTIGKVHRYRHREGFTVVDIKSSAFKEWIRTAIADSDEID